MRKTIRIIVKRFWGVCALLLILLAVFVQLGRVAAPRIGDYRPQIVAYLSQVLGADVAIETLSAEWEGLSPKLNLGGVVITSAGGEQILAIGSARAELNLLRSLVNLRLVPGSIELARADMMFRQNQQGVWSLVGLESSTTSDNFNIDDPLDVLLLTRQIEFRDTQFTFEFRTGHRSEVTFPHLRLDNRRNFHRLSSDVAVDREAEVLSCIVEWRGDPRNRQNFSASGYLRLKDFELDKAVAALPGEFWDSLPDQEWRKGHDLDLEAWVKVGRDYEVATHGRIDIGDLGATLDRRIPLPKQSGANFVGHWRQAAGWELTLRNILLDWGEMRAPALDVALTSAGLGHPVTLHVASLDLETWIATARNAGLLQDRWLDAANNLQPRGTLQRLQFTIAGVDPQDLHLRAEARDLAINAWHGVPALSGIDGYVETSSFEGFFNLHGGEVISAAFPKLYADAFELHDAEGQVRWHVDREARRVRVRSGALVASGPLGEAEGIFSLDLPFKMGSEPNELVLRVDLRNGQALDHSKLVPNTLPDSLRDWLATSIVTGKVNSGSFLYRGGIGPGDAEAAAIQLALDVSDATLQFDANWPALTKAEGRVWLNDFDAKAEISRGRLLDSDVTDLRVQVSRHGAAHSASLLTVRGNLTGDLRDGLTLLRDTPLSAELGSSLDHWSARGAMSAKIDLRLGLGTGEVENLAHTVVMDLRNASLVHGPSDLALEQISGRLRYNNDDGLFAEALTAQLWERRLQAAIRTESGNGADHILVDATGEIDVTALQPWIPLPVSAFVEGATQTRALLRIPFRNPSGAPELELRSDLIGLAVDLPAPFGKPANGSTAFRLRAPLSTQSQDFHLTYGDQLDLRLRMADGRMTKAAVGIGQEAVLPDGPALLVSGSLNTFDLSQWQDVLQRYRDANTTSNAGADVALPLALNLRFDEFIFGETTVERLHLLGEQQPKFWRFQFDAPITKGSLIAFADAESPYVVQLDYLRLPKTEPRANIARAINPFLPQPKHDALADWEPSTLPAMYFFTNELTVADENYGSWSFALEPTDNGVRVNRLIGNVRGGQILGEQVGEGATLWWEKVNGQTQSRFRGRFVAADLASVMEQWQQPQLLRSRRADLRGDFHWLGSPAAVDLNALAGDLSIHIEEGSFIRGDGPPSTGSAFLQLISIVNFDSWVRRLRLDFSDLSRRGMAFDEINGSLRFDYGKVYFAEPVIVEAPSSRFQMAGMVDLRRQQIDTKLIATLPVSGNLTFFTALAAGLPAALGVYVISKVFKEQVDKVASVSYKVTGSLDDPDLEFDSLFDDEIESTGQPASTSGNTPIVQTQ